MERFSHHARRVLSLAHGEAKRLRHKAIGTEHLLIGLVMEERGIAGQVLRKLGLEPGRVIEMVGHLTDEGTDPPGRIELSRDTEQVLQLSIDEARHMSHHFIGTEHLLLGITRATDSVALEVLNRLEVSPEQIKGQTLRILKSMPVDYEYKQTQLSVGVYRSQLAKVLETALNDQSREFQYERSEIRSRLKTLLQDFEHLQRILDAHSEPDQLREHAHEPLAKAIDTVRDLLEILNTASR